MYPMPAGILLASIAYVASANCFRCTVVTNWGGILLICTHPAPGAPGIEPRWTGGAKDAVGTAYSVSSRLWYTMAGASTTEIYYPTIDTPQIRDLQYLISDGRPSSTTNAAIRSARSS